MRLALYSSGLRRSDKTIDEAVWQLLGKPTHPRLLLLVASPDAIDFVTPSFPNYLTPFCKPEHTIILPTAYNREEVLTEIEKADLIFLSGGNTYYFLKNLRELGIISVLHTAAQKKVIVGSSAGSILMTPIIEVAAYPTEQPDENEVELKDLSALGFVKFEITPHYVANESVDAQLRGYTIKSGRPLYALTDGTGIIIDGNKNLLFGNIVMFDNGEKIKIQCRK